MQEKKEKTVLNNPLIWWSAVAVCFYISDCIIKFSPQFRKWRASEKDSTPPRWAIIIQNLIFTCLWGVVMLSAFVSVIWLLGAQALPDMPTSKFWEAVAISAGIISLVKYVNQHTTWENAMAIDYIPEEARLGIRKINERRMSRCEICDDGYDCLQKPRKKVAKNAKKMARVIL